MKDQSSYIKELIVRYVQGNSNVSDKEQLGNWIADSKANQATFRQLEKEVIEGNPTECDDEWGKFVGKYDLKEKQGKVFRLGLFTRYAAALALILATSFGIYILQSPRANAPYESLLAADDSMESEQTQLTLADGEQLQVKGSHANIEVDKEGSFIQVEQHTQNTARIRKDVQLNKLVVPYGKTAKLTLADGTHVSLNAGSRLVFPLAFDGKKREVFLEGEAFFDVKHDEERPFKVLTDQMKFTVLGTSFNINAYEDKKEVAAVLVDGSLKVESKGLLNKKQVILKPGQKSNYRADVNKMNVARVETDYYTSWKDGYLLMRKSNITAVVERLKRFYHQDVTISDEVLKKNHKITGKLILTDNHEQTFAALCEITDMKYFIQNDTILLIDRN